MVKLENRHLEVTLTELREAANHQHNQVCAPCHVKSGFAVDMKLHVCLMFLAVLVAARSAAQSGADFVATKEPVSRVSKSA
jgi:hypothetical protein